MSQVSPTSTPSPAAPPVLECPRCHEWLVGRDDFYCGFCGNFLLHFSITPEQGILIAGLGTVAARQKTFTLKNGDKTPVKVKISQVDPGLPGLVVEPPELTVPAHGEAQLIIRLDETKLPPQLQEKRVRLRCVIGGDLRKLRELEIFVKTGPKPTLTPKSLNFGQLQESTEDQGTQARAGSATQATRSLTIRNSGGTPLMVEKVTVEGSSRLRAVAPSLPHRLDPGASLQLKAVWDTTVPEQSAAGSTTGLRIHYRNAESSVVLAEVRLVRFAVTMAPEKVTLSPVFSKHDYLERIELANQGTVDVEIVAFKSDQPWLEVVSRYNTFYLLSPTPAEKRTSVPVPAGENLAFEVVCHPQSLSKGKHKGQIEVVTASGQNLVLPVEINVIQPVQYLEYIGIDFGTTNSVVAVYNEAKRNVELVEDSDGEGGRSPLIPSILTLRDAKTYLIGHQARNEAMTLPESTVRSIKRIMGYDDGRELFGKKFAPEQLASLIIKKLIELAESRLYELSGKYYDIKRAIVTVPVNFYDMQIRGILTACALAGIDTEESDAEKKAAQLKELHGTEVNTGIILDEPSAAALYFIHHLTDISGEPSELLQMIDGEKGLHLLVFDYGGGTLDVSVTHMKRIKNGDRALRILANVGDNRVGGDSIDLMVMRELLSDCRARYPTSFDDTLIRDGFHRLEERRREENWSDSVWATVLRARMIWKEKAEGVKIQLSHDEATISEIPSEAIFHLRDGKPSYSAVPFEALYDSKRFSELIKPTLKRCTEILRSALDLAGLQPKDIDYVLHSGRQSFTKEVRSCVREIFPGLGEDRNLFDERHLKVCVAQGAAHCGLLRNIPAEENSEVRIVNEGRRLPHGYGLEKRVLMHRVYEEIIPRGAEYPLTARVKLDRSVTRAGGPLRLKFYQNTGTSQRIGDSEIHPIGEIEVRDPTDDEHERDIMLQIDSSRRLEITVGQERVEVKSLRQLDEEDWLG